MSPFAIAVRTPFDFQRTLCFHDYRLTVLVPSPGNPVEETLVRRSLDEIFGELQYIDLEDRELVASFTESLRSPLTSLEVLGYTIFAVVSTGVRQGGTGDVTGNWRRAEYFITQRDAYVSGSSTVHRFDPSCRALLSTLIEAVHCNDRLQTWHSATAVRSSFEQQTPWCLICCLNEIILSA